MEMARSNWWLLERDARTALRMEAGGGWRGYESTDRRRMEVAAEKSPAARWRRIIDSLLNQVGSKE